MNLLKFMRTSIVLDHFFYCSSSYAEGGRVKNFIFFAYVLYGWSHSNILTHIRHYHGLLKDMDFQRENNGEAGFSFCDILRMKNYIFMRFFVKY